jgi:hypothetical protein
VEGDENNTFRNVPILANASSPCGQQVLEEKSFLPPLIVIASNNFGNLFLVVLSNTLHPEVGVHLIDDGKVAMSWAFRRGQNIPYDLLDCCGGMRSALEVENGKASGYTGLKTGAKNQKLGLLARYLATPMVVVVVVVAVVH